MTRRTDTAMAARRAAWAEALAGAEALGAAEAVGGARRSSSQAPSAALIEKVGMLAVKALANIVDIIRALQNYIYKIINIIIIFLVSEKVGMLGVKPLANIAIIRELLPPPPPPPPPPQKK